jgi:NAD(P)H dehydrogenase (quinone)
MECFHFIGMDVLPPFIAYRASRVPPEQREAYLDSYRDRLLSIESTAPIDFDRAAEATG